MVWNVVKRTQKSRVWQHSRTAAKIILDSTNRGYVVEIHGGGVDGFNSVGSYKQAMKIVDTLKKRFGGMGSGRG